MYIEHRFTAKLNMLTACRHMSLSSSQTLSHNQETSVSGKKSQIEFSAPSLSLSAASISSQQSRNKVQRQATQIRQRSNSAGVLYPILAQTGAMLNGSCILKRERGFVGRNGMELVAAVCETRYLQCGRFAPASSQQQEAISTRNATQQLGDTSAVAPGAELGIIKCMGVCYPARSQLASAQRVARIGGAAYILVPT